QSQKSFSTSVAEREGFEPSVPFDRRFPVVPLRPLGVTAASAGHLAAYVLALSVTASEGRSLGRCGGAARSGARAEREGFEPSVPFDTHDFQSCPFGHSGISPVLSGWGGCISGSGLDRTPAATEGAGSAPVTEGARTYAPRRPANAAVAERE